MSPAPAEIRLRYLDHENEIREIAAKGLLATCMQHEIEHLDGVLFVDHLSLVKRGMILRKLAKAKRSRSLARLALAFAVIGDDRTLASISSSWARRISPRRSSAR